VQAAVLSSDGRVVEVEQSNAGNGPEPVRAEDAEIRDALAAGEGRSMRRNDALRRDFLYYALSFPAARGGSPGGNAGTAKENKDAFILRLAMPLPDVDQQFAATRRPVWTAFLVLLACGILISLIDAHNLSRRIGGLSKFAGRMAALDFRPLDTQRVAMRSRAWHAR